MPQVVLASRLSDGRVVFAARAKGAVQWVELIEAAEVSAEGDAADGLLAAAEADIAAHNTVMDAYLIDVVEEGGARRPTKYREFIRALGPTIRADLGKQAEGAEA